MDTARLICDRGRAIDTSGIRRVFQLAQSLDDPINLSIGQPDFAVPHAIKRGAIEAIEQDRNGYTPSVGIPGLLERIDGTMRHDLGWDIGSDNYRSMVTSGTAGGLLLLFLALMGPGDEAVIPDPYFVMYPHLATIAGGTAVRCDTYPDFRMTAERVEPLLTERTKLVLFNSPNNPSGVVSSKDECRELLELCRSRGVLLVSDEIYDEFTFADGLTDSAAADPADARCPSPARFNDAQDNVLVIRGFGKTYGCTGWRMGYAAGPAPVIDAMLRIQGYTFVCAPSIAQWGALAAMDVSMAGTVDAYQQRRDRVYAALSEVTDLAMPRGAFYAFPRVPEHLGMTGTAFVERCIERNLLVIPGAAFSDRDTHIRLSFAAPDAKLDAGLALLQELMRGES
ncbi:MAG: aminotransferase class I/II-fold pyridoxal phosphate-dependent enzyme [Planctomycetota bacterium]